MNKHKLTILGGLHGELRVSASVLHNAIGVLIEGSRLATRFAVEGQSVRKGPRPSWLDAVCAIDITGLSAGSAVVSMEAPTLREADATRFGSGAQASLLADVAQELAEHTAVDLFGKVLAAVVEGNPDNIAADKALLDTCVKFAKVAGHGLAGLQLEGLRGRETPLVITLQNISQLELLRDEAPLPQAARVVGTLDTISASRSDVVLKLKDGTRLSARLENHEPDALKEMFGEKVVISGMAHYHPSGRLLFLEVESIGDAGAGDRLFEKAPLARKYLPVAAPMAQDDASGVSAFFGAWPGDESDHELLKALQAIG